MPSSISTISTTENKIIHDTWLQLFTGVEMTRTRDFSSRCRCWSRVVFADQCFVDQYLDDMCLGDMRLDKMYLEVRCLDSLQNFTPAVITSCWSVEVTKLLLLGNIVTKYNLLVGGRNTVVSWPWSRDAILSHRNAIRISRFLALSRRISPHLILCISSALSPSRTLSLSLYLAISRLSNPPYPNQSVASCYIDFTHLSNNKLHNKCISVIFTCVKTVLRNSTNI